MNSDTYISVGIDWADAKHDFHLITDQGESIEGIFKQNPQAIEEQVKAWRTACPGATFAVAIETTKGALINALMQYNDVRVYPVNPNSLANYRKAFAHGGGKSDIKDARLLAQFTESYRDSLRPLQRDSELTRKLLSLSEDRRRLVDARADLTNELVAVLKAYFPAALDLKPARRYAEFFLKLLAKYSTLAQAQKAGETRLRKFFHGLGMKKKADQHAKILCNAQPLTEDQATIEIGEMRMLMLVEQMQIQTKHIKRYNSKLEKLLPEHEGYQFIQSLPGASTKTYARMLGALGDDRTRYSNAESLQNASGISPITTASGKSRRVNARWAYTKFMRQTFHEYAGLSRAKSRWAKVFYDQQLAKGNSHNQATRSLAYKWQRIIFRLWQTGESYSETRYIDQLRKTKSPLYEAIQNAA